MKYSDARLLCRILAAALALAALPAFALAAGSEADSSDALIEIIEESSGVAAIQVPEIQDLLLPDEIPTLQSGETVLPEPSQAAEVRANTSTPASDYKPKDYWFDVDEKSSFSMKVGDTLEIYFPDENGKKWTSSKAGIVSFSALSDQESVYLQAAAAGTTKLTLTLTSGKKYTITLNVADPYALKSMSLSKKSVSILAGRDIDLSNYITLKPAYAKTSFTYKSSKPSVAKVSDGGIVTGMKSGVATITITASTGLKKTLKVTVKANTISKLHSAPTAKAAKSQGKKWTLWPKALELRGDGSLLCRLYLLNGGGGKLKSLNNLDLAVSLDTANGENLIAHSAFKTVSVSCAKNGYCTVQLVFPAKKVYYSGVKLSSLDKSKLVFRLYKKPTAKNGKTTYAYNPSAIPVAGDPTADNPVSYRALLVSESDFYFSYTPGQSWAWEHITRNKGDATLMKKTLKRVKTPSGGRYAVTQKNNTTRDQLIKLIKTTFAGADENDVSLFFIATHGDSDDDTAASEAGALVMASLDETYPENFYLSELRDLLLKVPGKVIVILESCGSGASIYKSNGSSAYKRAKSFDAKTANLFRAADPGLAESAAFGSAATNTGELRKVNKFYVLCCSEYREESWGTESASTGSYGNNFFTLWLTQGIGKSGSMPADKKYAGNQNGAVDLHELYRYVSVVGDRYPIRASTGTYYQHVQVYPSDVRYTLFK